MRSSRLRYLGLLFVVLPLMGGLLGCDAIGGPSKPTIVITAPTNGAEFQVGDEVSVLSSANDAKGVIRVELYVDGVLYRTDPGGGSGLAMFQTWLAEGPGMHTLSVVAINEDGVGSKPWAVTVRVVDDGLSPSPSPTTDEAPPPTATTAVPPPPGTATTPPPTPTQPPGSSDAPLINYFRANGAEGSITVDAGTTVTLSWEWERVSEGHLDPGNVGLACPTMPCTRNVSPGSTTTYTLRAINSSGTAEDSVTVEVRAGSGGSGPDLVVDNLVVTPSEVEYGTSMEVAVGVMNVGDMPSGPYAVRWQWGREAGEVCEWEQPSLPARNGGTLRCTVDEVVGVAQPTVATVDSRGQVDESNEDNNSKELTIRVYYPMGDPPDLYISEIRIEPAERVQGERLTVSIHVHNGGGTDTGTAKVIWYSGEPDGQRVWYVGINAGNDHWIDNTYTYTGRGHFLTHAIIDVDGDVHETDEDNNEAWLDIDVVHP